MSDLDIVNFLMIDDVGKGGKATEHLNDLRDKAAYLAKKTGREPMSWYEFKEKVPQEKPNSLRNLSVGAAIGVGLGALLGGLTLAAAPVILSLGFMGGAMGAFSDTSNRRRSEVVNKYENYLDQFEQITSLGKAPGLDKTPPPQEGEQVAKLRQEQASGIAR
jgi:hypothetical protein